MRKSNLPPEVVIDLALEILDIASRKLAPSPINRQAIGLGAARWRDIDAEQRSEIMRRAVEARWAKRRKSARLQNRRSSTALRSHSHGMLLQAYVGGVVDTCCTRLSYWSFEKAFSCVQTRFLDEI